MGEISQQLSEKKRICSYQPLGGDQPCDISLSSYGTNELLGWSGTDSTDSAFSVRSESRNFMFFVEQGSYQEVAAGGIWYTVTPGLGALISADRYSAIRIGSGAVAEGFWISRLAVETAITNTYERSIPASFEFEPVHDLINGPGAHLLKLMRLFRDDMHASHNLVASPIALASFHEMFCLLMVQNLRHTLSDVSAPVNFITPRQVRRGMEFARAHAAMPIAISDMAAAAGVSTRALQQNFRRFLGVTPMGYLRQLRLESAHYDLVNADPSATITEIAQRWGFVHMGRFAKEYRAAFGVSPSTDLARLYEKPRRMA